MGRTLPAEARIPPSEGARGSHLCLDTADDGGIRVVSEVDSLDRLVADLRADPRLDGAGRRSIVAEMSEWMFTRPIKDQIQAALGSAHDGQPDTG